MTGRGGARPGAGRPRVTSLDDAERFATAKADKEEALAQLRQMEAQTRAGQLLELADVQETVSVAFKQIAQSVFSLPDNLERKAGLTAAQAAECERICDGAMADLHANLAGLTLKEKTNA